MSWWSLKENSYEKWAVIERIVSDITWTVVFITVVVGYCYIKVIKGI